MLCLVEGDADDDVIVRSDGCSRIQKTQRSSRSGRSSRRARETSRFGSGIPVLGSAYERLSVSFPMIVLRFSLLLPRVASDLSSCPFHLPSLFTPDLLIAPSFHPHSSTQPYLLLSDLLPFPAPVFTPPPYSGRPRQLGPLPPLPPLRQVPPLRLGRQDRPRLGPRLGPLYQSRRGSRSLCDVHELGESGRSRWWWGEREERR
jgi:hypothetical protein